MKFKIIFKALIDLYISHDEFVSVNNVLGEYYEITKKMKNPETSVGSIIKNNGNLFCQLWKIYWEQKFKF